MKEVVAKMVAAYVAIGEIPLAVDLLGIMVHVLVKPRVPVPEAALQKMVEDGIVGAVVPWWIEPAQWLTPYPLLLLGFFGVIIWARKL